MRRTSILVAVLAVAMLAASCANDTTRRQQPGDTSAAATAPSDDSAAVTSPAEQSTDQTSAPANHNIVVVAKGFSTYTPVRQFVGLRTGLQSYRRR